MTALPRRAVVRYLPLSRRPAVYRDHDLRWIVRYRDGRYQTTQIASFATHLAAIVFADDVARLGPHRANTRQSARNATALGRRP